MSETKKQPRFDLPKVRLAPNVPAEAHVDPGFGRRFADAFMLDSFAGQLIQRSQIDGLNSLMRRNEDPRYNALTDPELNLDTLDLGLLDELADAVTRDDAMATLEMSRINAERERRLSLTGGSFGTRLLAGFADPVNLVPVPIALGRGFVTGFKSTLIPNAGIVGATEIGRSSLDPNDTVLQTSINIGMGTLMASLIGGAAGLIPGGYGIPRGSRAYEKFNNLREHADLAGGRGISVKDQAITREVFEAEVKPRLKEDVTFEQFIRDQADDGLPTEAIRFQAVRHGDDAFGDRYYIIPDRTEGGFRLVRRDDKTGGQVIATGNDVAELMKAVDGPDLFRVHNFGSRDAIEIGRLKADDMFEGAPSRKGDPEAFEVWAKEKLSEDVPRDPHGVRMESMNGHIARAQMRGIMDAERMDVADNVADLEARVAALEADRLVLQRKLDTGKGFNKSLTKQQATDRLAFIDEELGNLKSRLRVSRETLDDVDKRIEAAEESNDPTDYMIKPTGTGLERVYGKSGVFPFFGLTETRLVKLAPDLAAAWQKIAYKLAGSPGLQYRGAERGVSVGVSAEMRAVRWWYPFREAKRTTDSAYARLVGYGEEMGPTKAMMVETRDQLRRTEGRVRNVLRMDRATSTAGEDIMTFSEFRRLVGTAMVKGDSAATFGLGDDVARAVEEAASAWRKFVREFEVEGRKTGVFQTQESLKKRGEWLQARIDEMEMKPGGKYVQERINELELELDQVELARESMKQAGPGEFFEPDFFPRLWDTAKIGKPGERSYEDLKDTIRDYFRDNPFASVNGELKKLSTDADDIEVRVEEAMNNITRSGEFSDEMGLMDIGDTKTRLINRLEALKTEREELLQAGQFTEKTVKVADLRNVPGNDLRKSPEDMVEFTKKIQSGEIKPEIIVEMRNGKAVNIIEGNHTLAVLDSLGREDVTVRLLNKTADLEMKRLERKIQVYDDAIKSDRAINNALPSPLMSRRINIHNNEVLNYIDTDVEQVMHHYLTRAAPVIEVARTFGDRNLRAYRDPLNLALDERIAELKAKGNLKQAKAIEEEKVRLNKSVDDLRDIVLGVYGISKNPAGRSARAVNLLTGYMNLTAMGKAALIAINDFGNVLGYIGFRRAFAHLGDFALARFKDDASEWNIARNEALMAGEAFEIEKGIRYAALTEIGGHRYGTSAVERFVSNEQTRLFMANMLTPWTDMMEGLAGAVAQSRIIEDAIALSAGKLGKKRTGELMKLGMTKQLAKRFSDEWHAIPLEHRKGRHLFMANTQRWKDRELAHQFSAMLTTEINNLVPTPKAADKPTFMHKGWGRVMFQYKSFPFAATTRIMMANMQRKDMRAMQTVVSMIFFSWVIDLIKRPDYIDLSLEDSLFRAVELSGVAGIMSDANSAIEGVTGGEYGLRPALGLVTRERNPNVQTQMGAILGPSVNQWSGLAHAFISDDADVSDQARAVRYALPYNNLLWWSGLVDRMQRGVASGLE